MNDGWGPLAGLAGEWEGDSGLDTAFSHARGEVFRTPYREKAVMKPVGPVVNGAQVLYGLDYRTAMRRGEETNPFDRATITVAEDRWSYDEVTMLRMAELAEPLPHTDVNTLHRTA